MPSKNPNADSGNIGAGIPKQHAFYKDVLAATQITHTLKACESVDMIRLMVSVAPSPIRTLPSALESHQHPPASHIGDGLPSETQMAKRVTGLLRVAPHITVGQELHLAPKVRLSLFKC